MGIGACAGFEGYRRGFGSWWNVQIADLRSDMFLVKYKNTNDEAWVPITQLRFRTRRADGWDCFLLEQGMDVCLLSNHPQSDAFKLQKEALYDARATSIIRSDHAPGECSCKFAVQFYSLTMDTYVNEILLERRLLTDIPEMEVKISNIRILQQRAEMIPLHQVLVAHLDRVWIPRDRVCKDAYFLIETNLSTNQNPKRRCFEDDNGHINVRSDEVLSPSAARVSPKNGDKESNCNSTADGHEKVGCGDSKHSSETVKEERRKPKSSSGTLNNQTQKHSVGHSDQTSPQTISIKQCAQDEKHDLLDEEPLNKKDPGRSKKVGPETRETIKRRPIRLCRHHSKIELVPRFKTDQQTKTKAQQTRTKAYKEDLKRKAEDKGESTETTSSNEESEWTPEGWNNRA